MKITTEVEISKERISDLLCSAFEGGSNYWYRIEEFIAPTGFDPKNPTTTLEFMSDINIGDARTLFKHLDYPLNAGGSLIITAHAEGDEDEEVNDQTKWTLNLESIEKGLSIMAEKYPHHWKTFLQDDDDAETGDVFLQCCLFGEIIYG